MTFLFFFLFLFSYFFLLCLRVALFIFLYFTCSIDYFPIMRVAFCPVFLNLSGRSISSVTRPSLFTYFLSLMARLFRVHCICQFPSIVGMLFFLLCRKKAFYADKKNSLSFSLYFFSFLYRGLTTALSKDVEY